MTEARRRQAIVNMAVDPAFADRVRTDPSGVAREFGLDAEDMAVLESLRDDSDPQRSTVLDPRLSKSSLFFGGGAGGHQPPPAPAHAGAGLFVCNFHPADTSTHAGFFVCNFHPTDTHSPGMTPPGGDDGGTHTEFSADGKAFGENAITDDQAVATPGADITFNPDGSSVIHEDNGVTAVTQDTPGGGTHTVVSADGKAFGENYSNADHSDQLVGAMHVDGSETYVYANEGGLVDGSGNAITDDQTFGTPGGDITFNPDGSSVIHEDNGVTAVTQDTPDGGTHTVVSADGKAFGENYSNADHSDQLVGAMHGDGSETYVYANEGGLVDGSGNAITDDQTFGTPGGDITFNPDGSSVIHEDNGVTAVTQDTPDGGTHTVVSADGKAFGENYSNADHSDQLVGAMHGDGSETYVYANEGGLVDGSGNAITDDQTVDSDGVDMVFHADGSSDTIDHQTGTVTHEAGDGPITDGGSAPSDDTSSKGDDVNNTGISHDLDSNGGQGPVDGAGPTDTGDEGGGKEDSDTGPATGDDSGGDDSDGDGKDDTSDDGGAPSGGGDAGMSDPGGDGGDDGNSGGHRPVGTGTGGVDGGEPGQSIEGSPGKLAAVHTGSGVGNHQAPPSGEGQGEGGVDGNNGNSRFDLRGNQTTHINTDDGTMTGTASHGAVDPTSGLHGAGH